MYYLRTSGYQPVVVPTSQVLLSLNQGGTNQSRTSGCGYQTMVVLTSKVLVSTNQCDTSQYRTRGSQTAPSHGSSRCNQLVPSPPIQHRPSLNYCRRHLACGCEGHYVEWQKKRKKTINVKWQITNTQPQSITFTPQTFNMCLCFEFFSAWLWGAELVMK